MKRSYFQRNWLMSEMNIYLCSVNVSVGSSYPNSFSPTVSFVKPRQMSGAVRGPFDQADIHVRMLAVVPPSSAQFKRRFSARRWSSVQRRCWISQLSSNTIDAAGNDRCLKWCHADGTECDNNTYIGNQLQTLSYSFKNMSAVPYALASS